MNDPRLSPGFFPTVSHSVSPGSLGHGRRLIALAGAASRVFPNSAGPVGSPASCCLHLRRTGVSYVSLFSDEDPNADRGVSRQIKCHSLALVRKCFPNGGLVLDDSVKAHTG